MTNSPEIEQIIRQVLERLATAGDLMAGVDQLAQVPESELEIKDRVVTLAAVESQLAGKSRVRVSSRAVVTPAVRDLLRSKQVELVRGGGITASKNANQPQAPLLVCGAAPWFASLSKSLCPKQAKVEACEDAHASKLITAHISRGGARAIWISNTPFAASVSAASSGCCRAVLLPSLRELSDAIAQANPQAFIVDAPRWTVAAVGNLVRTLNKSQ